MVISIPENATSILGGAMNYGRGAEKKSSIGDLDYPALNLKIKQPNKPHSAWTDVQAAPSNLQNFQGTDQLSELVTQMKMKKKSLINKQAISVLANIMQQMINASLEKKNKQTLLQKIAQQLEEFKDDLTVKVNSLSMDINHHQQQSKSISATPPSILLNRTTNQTKTTTISSNKGNNVPMDFEQSMEITDV
ncbi:unnamed protein product [Rotaria sp. Silwood1]|nr:unnamed protein product [Rotaria sp. Silwood1]